MRVTVNGIEYQTSYFPFIKLKDGWYLDLPTSKHFVFDEYTDEEAESILAFHVREYMLEDVDKLSNDAKTLKFELLALMHKVEKHPCFKCDKELTLFDKMHPSDGSVFRTYGTYGSTVFDPMDGTYIELLICDDCLVQHKSKLGGTGAVDDSARAC